MQMLQNAWQAIQAPAWVSLCGAARASLWPSIVMLLMTAAQHLKVQEFRHAAKETGSTFANAVARQMLHAGVPPAATPPRGSQAELAPSAASGS